MKMSGTREGDFNTKRTGCLGAPRTFLGLKKRVWTLLGCSASKGPRHELSRYLLGY